MAQKIRIRLKAYDHQQLDRSAAQIVDTAHRSGATVTMDQGLRFAVREGGRTVGAGVVTEIIR